LRTRAAEVAAISDHRAARRDAAVDGDDGAGDVAGPRRLKIMKRKAIDMLGDEARWQELFDKYPGKRPATSVRSPSRAPRCRRRW
jgi:hypothetical protein